MADTKVGSALVQLGFLLLVSISQKIQPRAAMAAENEICNSSDKSKYDLSAMSRIQEINLPRLYAHNSPTPIFNETLDFCVLTCPHAHQNALNLHPETVENM